MSTQRIDGGWINGSPAGSAQTKRRGGRRRNPDRGLPDEASLRDLAESYLVAQRRLWSDVAGVEIPEPSEAAVAGLVDDFRRRFRGESDPARADFAVPPGSSLVAYVRYSSDNSSPHSLVQQLELILGLARRNGHFVPWELVYADSAESATVVVRTGYTRVKAAIIADARIAVLYVDDLSRTNRYSLEMLRLGAVLVEKHRRRLLGVSDGFDSDQPHYKMLLHFYAMIHEAYVDGIRAKVRRGRRHAARKKRHVGRLAFGYALEPLTEKDGRPKLGPHGRPINRDVIDPDAAAVVLWVFESYAVRGWSPKRIARHRNETRAGGRTKWTECVVRGMLRRPVYVGIAIDNRTRQDRDPETGTITTIKNPIREWLVERRPELRIVPKDLWRAARLRLKKRKGLFKGGRRGSAEVYPGTLFRPICGSGSRSRKCGAVMILGRGGTKYQSFQCPNAGTGANGFQSKGYKSVRIVENAVLGAVRERLFSDGFVTQVLTEANAFLAQLAATPRPDLAPLRSAVKDADDKRKHLTEILVEHGKEGLSSVVERLQEADRRFARLRKELAAAEAAASPPPGPITREGVEALLADIRGLLESDKEAAAPILRELIGPVVIHQEPEPGSTRPAWYAEFTLDLAKVVVRLGGRGQCPTGDCLQFLKTRSWTISDFAMRVRAEHVRIWEKLAPRAAELAAEGLTIGAIAGRLGTDWATAHAALEFAQTGVRKPAKPAEKRRAWKRGRPRPGGCGENAPFRRHAAEAARLRDEEGLTWCEVGRRLGLSAQTARRAYNESRRQSRVGKTGPKDAKAA